MKRFNKELFDGIKLFVCFGINSASMFSFGYMVGGDEVRDKIRCNLKDKNSDNIMSN